MNPSELDSSSMTHQKYKVVLLGDSGVGKSSIIDRFVKGEIDSQNQPTVGIDFLSRNIIHSGKTYKLQLWDTAGQEKYRSLVPSYIRDANCALLVFETSRKQTFSNMASWLSLVRDHAPQSITIIMVANKSDLGKLSHCEHIQEIQHFAEQQRINLVESSAKTGANIELIFEQMVSELSKTSRNGSQTDLEVHQEKASYQFFLRYNRVNFDYGRQRKCCHI